MLFHFENPALCVFENRAAAAGYRKIAGIDEAGRGALAGPVVAACVLLDPENIPSGIDDSKRLTIKKRERLYKCITGAAVCTGIGVSGPKVVDRVNVYQATIQAMKQAVSQMPVDPDFLLIDAVKLYDISISSLSLIHGDQRSVSIAAASIVAKVYRDRLMMEYEQQYPAYGFGKHKGYGTARHRDALKRCGPTTLHRFSFKPVREADAGWRLKEQ
jgi:ribonuclease HII